MTNVKRLPLRTFRELCEELGVKEHQMVNYLGMPGAPKPALRVRGTVKNTWYEPNTFRAWFKDLKLIGEIK